MTFLKIIWSIWGLALGLFLFIGIFHKVPGIFDFALGGGSAWIICETLDNLFLEDYK